MMPREGSRSALTPSATVRSASMSRPESVSSRMHRRGSSIAICRISLRFFSPPEKPKLRSRLSSSSVTPTTLALARSRFMNSPAPISASPRARRWAFMAWRRKYMLATPGISTGYCMARNTPAAARSSGSSASRSWPSKVTLPPVTS